jgi:hypothetical protein
MAIEDQVTREKFEMMSRDELCNYVGTDDPSLSRDDLIIMAMQLDTSM